MSSRIGNCLKVIIVKFAMCTMCYNTANKT